MLVGLAEPLFGVWFSFFDEVVSVGWVRRWVEQKTGSWMSAHCWVLRGRPVVRVVVLWAVIVASPVYGVVVVVCGCGCQVQSGREHLFS